MRRRNLVVVVLLFALVILVSSFSYSDLYLSGSLRDKFAGAQDPPPQDSESSQAKEPSVALQNSFPSMQSMLHTGKSLVFEPEGISPQFDSEVLDPIADRTFVLLKTGSETMWSRLPVHIQTTMRRFPQNAIYSDIAAPIMGHQVIDALMHLPESALNSPGLFGYRVRRQDVYEHWAWGPRQLKIEGAGSGWYTDKHKNVPAFADAWQKSSNCEWFLMLDDDAYMLTTTLADLLRDKDPEQSWYLGKGVGHGPTFAHGGSGIILSRGAMRQIFGEPDDYARRTEVLVAAAKHAEEDCCGDSVVAKIYGQFTGVAAERDLELTESNQTYEHGIFQGNTLSTTRINYDSWCKPVGVFHHVAPWEIEQLFDWERVVSMRQIAERGSQSAVTYSEFYRDFVLPHVTDERKYWHFENPPADYKGVTYKFAGGETVMDDQKKLDPVESAFNCRRACELDMGCLTWHWQQNVRCQLFRYDVGRGEGLNPWSKKWTSEMTDAAAGFMTERIRAMRANSTCDSLTKNDAGEYNDDPSTLEGWYARKLKEITHSGPEWGIHPLKEEPQFQVSQNK